jgi:outer membrane protein OmpA-like peptidoglycan-associated protein
MLSTIDGIFNESRRKTIIVAGHTCSLGSEKYNLELSRKRAESVAAYLTQTKGIPNDNIRIEYYGEKLPLAFNDTEEGRSRNRRVEISFLSRDINYF